MSKMTERLWLPSELSAVKVAYTALGRMEALAGRPEGALEAARKSLAAGHQAKLRIFTPALKAFCAEGDFAKAFEARPLSLSRQLHPPAFMTLSR